MKPLWCLYIQLACSFLTIGNNILYHTNGGHLNNQGLKRRAELYSTLVYCSVDDIILLFPFCNSKNVQNMIISRKFRQHQSIMRVQQYSYTFVGAKCPGTRRDRHSIRTNDCEAAYPSKTTSSTIVGFNSWFAKGLQLGRKCDKCRPWSLVHSQDQCSRSQGMAFSTNTYI